MVNLWSCVLTKCPVIVEQKVSKCLLVSVRNVSVYQTCV